jgi:hypothetical protein
VLTHAEIIVGTPDNDVARSIGGVQRGVGKPAGHTLKISENTIAPLVMKAIKRVTEELAIIHDYIRKEARDAGPIKTFLEPFQPGCRDGIR